MILLVGFLPATDPHAVGTIHGIRRELTFGGLVYRCHPTASELVDGLPPGEDAFLPCSFWMVDCLNLSDEVDEECALFNGLLGNFSQAFSHVGFVNSAQNLTPGVVGPADVRSRLGRQT